MKQKALLPERIPHAKWSSLTWLADGSGYANALDEVAQRGHAAAGGAR